MLATLRKQELGKYGDDQWYATIAYKTETVNGESLARALLGSSVPINTAVWNTTSRIYEPICTKVDCQANRFPGHFALVMGHWTSTRKTGVATIRGRSSATARRMYRDLNNLPIEGPADDGVNYYHVQQGTNIIGYPNEIKVVQACYLPTDISAKIRQARCWMNRVNSDALYHLDAEAGVLQLWSFAYKPLYMGSATRWYLDYFFKVSPYRIPGDPTTILGWNDGLRVQKGVIYGAYLQMAQPNLMPAVGQFGKKTFWTQKHMLTPDGRLQPTAPELRTAFDKVDMGTLDQIVLRPEDGG